jgi:hypothetical protein
LLCSQELKQGQLGKAVAGKGEVGKITEAGMEVEGERVLAVAGAGMAEGKAEVEEAETPVEEEAAGSRLRLRFSPTKRCNQIARQLLAT